MAATIEPIEGQLWLLPPPPKTWDTNKEFKVFKSISAVETCRIEPAGIQFANHVRRILHNRTLEEDLELEAALHAGEDEDVNLEEDEEETKELLASDPNNWKEQDHYAILGISRLRYKANDDDIKRAYRRKVLKHHPDKKAASSGNTSDDAFFKCIQKAWEVLSDPVKRRQWDSVDPQFDENLPSGRALKPGEDFFKIFGPGFEKESRFSKKELPPFGDVDSTREEVEAFYDAWFNFDSWRTFELLDEEDEGSGERLLSVMELTAHLYPILPSREEKRYYERKNRAARLKLKKEDNARILRFVEAALKNDPRIIRIREEEKAAKEAKRKEKEWAAQAEKREAERKAEEERVAKEKEEKEEKERRELEKKEKEAHKKLVRKMRKGIRDVFAEHNNLAGDGVDGDEQVTKLEALFENSEIWHLEEFRFRLDQEAPKGVAALKKCFEDELASMKERQAQAAKQAEATKAAAAAAAASGQARKAKAPWTPKEQAMLIKAFKSFPGGTVQRWEKIAEYVNLHGVEEGEEPGSRARGPDDCIRKSKELQAVSMAERAAMQDVVAGKKKEVEVKDAPTNREVVNSDLNLPKAGANGAVANGPAAARPPTPSGKKAARSGTATPPPGRSETPPPANVTANGFVVPENDSWTAAQQAQLEAALRKYPAAQFASAPSERWEKIAGEVDGKNKKEVKARVKELHEAVKKKNKK
ncbi:hypothetical protein HDU96_005538 [Phlyctochytrium bullatum]|nr:hypothetical protein HDU96_005538 [Phlyctochytrium bullatum]